MAGKNDLVVLDFETTGLQPGEDEILQVALVDGAGQVLMNEYCSPVRHSEWAQAARVNGITAEMVRGKPPFAQLLGRLLPLLQAAGAVVAYNVGFERSFLQAYGVPAGLLHWAPDPMALFAEKTGGPRRTLSAAAGFFGDEFAAHDALADTQATLRLYRRLTGAPLLEQLTENSRPGDAPGSFGFEQTEDWLRLLKLLRLCPFTAKQPKQLYYRGLFAQGVQPCRVVGFLLPPLGPDALVLEIEAGSRRLRVCDGYLREMQAGGGAAPAEGRQGPAAPTPAPAEGQGDRAAPKAAAARAEGGAAPAGAAAQRPPRAARPGQPAAPGGKGAGGRGRYQAFAAKKADLKALTPNPNADPANPFFGRAVVFTGDLALPRAAAAAQVAALGGQVKSSVSKKTDYLVVGAQDAALVGPAGRSGKQAYAEQLNREGKAKIRLLDEAGFMALLQAAGAGGGAAAPGPGLPQPGGN